MSVVETKLWNTFDDLKSTTSDNNNTEDSTATQDDSAIDFCQ